MTTSLTSDLRGASRLIVDGVTGVTDIVESMHRNISGLAPIVGRPRVGPTRGVTGLVYRSVRGVSRLVGGQVDFALKHLAPLLDRRVDLARHEAGRAEARLAALNGVLGDYLEATGNPLSIPMRLRSEGRKLALERQELRDLFPNPSDKLVVMVHGLCMNDLQWTREVDDEHSHDQRGHDHGAALAKDLGYTPVYLHYNSGLPITTNGRRFAELLESLVGEWPVPVRELVVVGYSMGGLVARSACHHAKLAGHDWPSRLARLVFLGTPHHGALLERAGNWLDVLLGISPYSAPIARLGGIRSDGIRDLRYGNVIDHRRDSTEPIQLPEGVECFAIAASRQPGPDGACRRGDGLVAVKSALGDHRDPRRSLGISRSRQAEFYGLKHFDLLSSREVYDQIQRWLGGGAGRRAS